MAPFNPTEEQRLAILFDGDMVVTARPGSGKTSVLTQKIRRMLPALKNYQGIVAISYTNKASEELGRRCRQDAFDTKRSFFGTIDDFCLRELIRPFARHVMAAHSELRTTKAADLPHALHALLPEKSVAVRAVDETSEYLPFLSACLQQGFIPLEAIGMLACYMVDYSQACRRYLQAKYKAVFVDEFQDSDYFQHQLFLRLKNLGFCAVAVGDGDQSVFRFAHKDPKYLLSLSHPGSGFTPFAITINHRSHPSITNYALRLIDPNAGTLLTKENRVYRKDIAGDQTAIAAWLKTALPNCIRNFKIQNFDRVAILCRNHHSAAIIAAHLDLPHYLFGESPFVLSPSEEAAVFSDLLLLRFDNKLTAQDILKARSKMRGGGAAEAALRKQILQCRSCSIDVLFAHVSQVAAELLGRQLSLAGADELKVVCGDHALLLRFKAPASNQVQIMTLHKAKGLEFDVVFHADLYDYILPKRRIIPGNWDVVFEDEVQCLNLHYVGITRAIKACVLITSNQRINGTGETKTGFPSQFFGRNGATAVQLP